MSANNPGRQHINELLDNWLMVANTAVTVIKRKRKGGVTIVNAGDQIQKHPAVTVLEAASKRIEALVVLADRFAEGSGDASDDLDDELPDRWKPTVA